MKIYEQDTGGFRGRFTRFLNFTFNYFDFTRSNSQYAIEEGQTVVRF